MDLIPKKQPIVVKVLYLGALLIGVTSFILFLYGYLWRQMVPMVKRSIAQSYTIENMQRSCETEADCAVVCGSLPSSDSCLCLAGRCQRVNKAQYFDEHKFCETDLDCTVSCYEGPVSKAYFEKHGGMKLDCDNGCLAVSYARTDGTVNPPVCKIHQCQYQNGQTCFMQQMPNP